MIVEDVLIGVLVVPACVQAVRLVQCILLLLETSCPPQLLVGIKYACRWLRWQGVLGVFVALFALICYPEETLATLSHLSTILLSFSFVLVSLYILSNEVYLPWEYWLILSVLFLATSWLYPTVICLLKLGIQTIVAAAEA